MNVRRAAGPLLLLLLLAAEVLAAQDTPYAIDRRPQPRGTVLDTLLPSAVGPFSRPALRPQTPVPVNDELQVRYGAGADSVVLSFRIPGLPEEAQAAVRARGQRASARRADPGQRRSVTGHDPSYVRGDRLFVWSRGGYYFATAASSEDALERFMRAFPY